MKGKLKEHLAENLTKRKHERKTKRALSWEPNSRQQNKKVYFTSCSTWEGSTGFGHKSTQHQLVSLELCRISIRSILTVAVLCLLAALPANQHMVLEDTVDVMLCLVLELGHKAHGCRLWRPRDGTHHLVARHCLKHIHHGAQTRLQNTWCVYIIL